MGRDRQPYDHEIDWYLNYAEGDLGLHGTLQSTVSTLELGGPANIGAANCEVPDARLAAATKQRRIRRLWDRLTPDVRSVLVSYYDRSRPIPSVIESELGQGARLALTVLPTNEIDRCAKACHWLATHPTAHRYDEGEGRGHHDVVQDARTKTRLIAIAAHRSLDAERDLVEDEKRDGVSR
jgi:hypothetical protein